MPTKKYKAALLKHLADYPASEITDIFKLINQAAFGTGHLVKSREAAAAFIAEELTFANEDASLEIEEIDGSVFRVHLSYLEKHGLAADTLAALFDLTSRIDMGGEESLRLYLEAFSELIDEGKIHIKKEDFVRELELWKKSGYSAPRHSENYRKIYNPHYRVISNRFKPYLPLLSLIDKTLLKKGRATVALEGGSASGKTTLSAILEEIYGATVFHTDDFYLPLARQDESRLTAPGECTDHERFLAEVVLPSSRGEAVNYRRFDCAEQRLMPPVKINPTALTVCEGAYSAHPSMEKYYDLIAFLDVDEEVQRKRIEKRNTPAIAKRHFEEWIPREELYFSATGIKDRCDIIIPITE